MSFLKRSFMMAVSSTNYIIPPKGRVTCWPFMDRKASRRKWPSPDFRCCPVICLVVLSKQRLISRYWKLRPRFERNPLEWLVHQRVRYTRYMQYKYLCYKEVSGSVKSTTSKRKRPFSLYPRKGWRRNYAIQVTDLAWNACSHPTPSVLFVDMYT